MKFIAILLVALLGPATASANDALHIEEFGVSNGPPVFSGFMFVNGKYLDCPYTVSRRGVAVFVNDTMVVSPMRWPVRPPPSGDIDPRLPSTITTNTSFFDETLAEYRREKSAYILKHHPREDEAKLMEQVLRELPCVKSATLDLKNPHLLHIVTYRGEEIPCVLRKLTKTGIDFSKRENVLAHLERQREYYERNLQRGDCVFLTRESGQMSVGANQGEFMMPLARVLSADAADEQKFSVLAKNQFFARFRTNDLMSLVINNSGSSQLVSRATAAFGAYYKE